MSNIGLDDFFAVEQYSLDKERKNDILLSFLNEVHKHHYENSPEYQNITQALFDNRLIIKSIKDLPYIPVSLFKQRALKSIPEDQVYKVIFSSGTTGSVPSRVYLDAEMARVQTKALSKIVTHIIGNERLPMLIVDSKSILKDRTAFSARGAGVLGLSIFGKKHQYLLDDEFRVDMKACLDFFAEHNGQKILIFGFTFMVWQYLYLADFDFEIDLSNAILIHSGGWKKMQEMSVDSSVFKQMLFDKFKLSHIYNFYGMAEQVGSVFFENSEGYLHCPNYSDVIIRNPVDFSVQENGKEGLVQVISILPKSYPGHSIVTEDIGVCMGEDDSSNGWKGKYFKILGRAKKAEIRGCSDTFSK
jgi:hypothetical protein